MKKSVVAAAAPVKTGSGTQGGWLDVEELASVEVTSEDQDFPVESVFVASPGPGWRAGEPGRQVIRLLFSQPQAIHRIHLAFTETTAARMQEFTLRWANSLDGSFHEIVRQQWNFSPEGSRDEIEDYQVNLAGVTVLELAVNPDVSGGGAFASLAQWRVA